MREYPEEIQRRRFLKCVFGSAVGWVMLPAWQYPLKSTTTHSSVKELERILRRYGGEFGGVFPGEEV